MLTFHAGRFPHDTKDPWPTSKCKWLPVDKTTVRCEKPDFMVTLLDNDTKWSIHYTERVNGERVTKHGECRIEEETGIIRLDSEEMLDFWMELERV